MSMEAGQAPGGAKKKDKKRKKDKELADSSSKKRKRDEVQQDAVPEQSTEQSAKKRKRKEVLQDAVLGATDEQSAKKQKREEAEQDPTPDTQSAPVVKKRKKDKASQDETPSKPQVSSQVPVDDLPKETEQKSKKETHKKHKDHVQQQHPPPPAPIVEEATKSSEKKRKKHKDKQQVASIISTGPSQEDLLKSHSPFIQQTTSFYLPLSPAAYNFPLEGLCAEHISPSLLTYHPPLNGVLLSYTNPRLSEHPETGQVITSVREKEVLGQSIDEYGVTYVWLTAEFVVFRPEKGRWLEGHVSLQNESLLGMVCYNYFNAVIERQKLPQDWRWEGDDDEVDRASKKKRRKRMEGGGGYWADKDGKKIEGRIVFRVEDFEANPGYDGSAGTVSIIGTLRTDNDKT